MKLLSFNSPNKNSQMLDCFLVPPLDHTQLSQLTALRWRSLRSGLKVGRAAGASGECWKAHQSRGSSAILHVINHLPRYLQD